MTDKQTNNKGRTAHNSGYVAIAGVLVNRRSVHLRNFVLYGKESASNPPLHIHVTVVANHRATLDKEDFYEAK